MPNQHLARISMPGSRVCCAFSHAKKSKTCSSAKVFDMFLELDATPKQHTVISCCMDDLGLLVAGNLRFAEFGFQTGPTHPSPLVMRQQRSRVPSTRLHEQDNARIRHATFTPKKIESLLPHCLLSLSAAPLSLRPDKCSPRIRNCLGSYCSSDENCSKSPLDQGVWHRDCPWQVRTARCPVGDAKRYCSPNLKLATVNRLPRIAPGPPVVNTSFSCGVNLRPRCQVLCQFVESLQTSSRCLPRRRLVLAQQRRRKSQVWLTPAGFPEFSHNLCVFIASDPFVCMTWKCYVRPSRVSNKGTSFPPGRNITPKQTRCTHQASGSCF